jgi:carbon storage regulator CsrA
LILTRELGQGIVLSFGSVRARITIEGVRGRVVRVGIDAPVEVIAHRDEVQWRVDEEDQMNSACACGASLSTADEQTRGRCAGCGEREGVEQ